MYNIYANLERIYLQHFVKSYRSNLKNTLIISYILCFISAPPKIKLPARFKEVTQFEKGEDIVLKIPFTGFPKPKVHFIGGIL